MKPFDLRNRMCVYESYKKGTCKKKRCTCKVLFLDLKTKP